MDYLTTISVDTLLKRANYLAAELVKSFSGQKNSNLSIEFNCEVWKEYYPYDTYVKFNGNVSYPKFVICVQDMKQRFYLESIPWIISTVHELCYISGSSQKSNLGSNWCELKPLLPDNFERAAMLRLYEESLENYQKIATRYLSKTEFASLPKYVGMAWSFGHVSQLSGATQNSLKSLSSKLKIGTGEFVRPVFYELLSSMVSNHSRHVQLMGPPGAGKSFVVEHLAKEKGKNLFNLNCDGKINRSHIEGVRGLKDGSTVFEISGVAQAAISGDWVKLDELNMAEPDAIVALNGVVAPPFKINVDGKQYDVHKDFRLFVTYNPGLSGTKSLPESLEDRLFPIKVLHPDPTTCGKILVSNGIDPEIALRLSKFAHTAWDSYNKNQIRYSVSTRRLVDAGLMLQDGHGWEDSIVYSVINVVKLPSDQNILLGIAKAI